jgi:hypothetical protein
VRRFRVAVWLRGINGHGVCYADVPANEASTRSRIIDLDVDIGADAVDYKYAPPAVSVLIFFF